MMKSNMRKISLLCVVFICLSLTFIACGQKSEDESQGNSQNTSQKVVYPEHYEKLVQLIGKDRETAFEVLELAEEDVELLAVGIYETPIEITYSDYSFVVLIEIDEPSGKMCAFWYRQKYMNDVDRAVNVINTLYKNLTEYYGEPEKTGKITQNYKEQADISENFFKGEVYSASEMWKVSDELNLYLEVSSDGNSNVAVQMKYKVRQE